MNLTIGAWDDEEENSTFLFYTPEDFEKGLNNIKMYVEKYQDMSESDKYYFLLSVFNIYYSNEDMVKLINIMKKTNYTKVVDIPTKMETEYTESEGHGKDFSWWIERRHFNLICAANDDFNLENKCYSYKELWHLINDGTIYPIYEYATKSRKKRVEDNESYESINIFVRNDINGKLWTNYDETLEVDSNKFEYIVRPNYDNVSTLYNYFKKEITSDDLFSYFRYYFDDIMEKLKMFNMDYLLPEYEEYYNEHFKNKKRLVKVKN